MHLYLTLLLLSALPLMAQITADHQDDSLTGKFSRLGAWPGEQWAFGA